MMSARTTCARCGKIGYFEVGLCDHCHRILKQAIKDGIEVYNEMREKYRHLRRLTAEERNIILDA